MGSATIEPEFADNARQLSEITTFFRQIDKPGQPKLLGISFGGSTSPDGSKEYNDSLTQARRTALETYFAERYSLPAELVSYDDPYIEWDKLRNRVAQSDLPHKDEVLAIIDEGTSITTYFDHLTIDFRILKLKRLHGGTTWQQLGEEFFPAMRYAKVVFAFREIPQSEESAAEDEAPGSEILGNYDSGSDSLVDTSSLFDASCRDQRLAIKTNFLYDAILMPSLEVEYKINNHWSVALEGDVAWWKNDPKHKYYQIATISPEVRYKFKASRPWHGHYVGAFTGFSWYDLENGGRGYKGEAGIFGLSYSYVWPIARRLSLEAGLGAGVMYTKYKEYLPIDGHYVYQQTSRLVYAGPLKVKFSLVWRLWNQDCKGGKQ